nr:S8 family serine peptidase [Agromyces seonyuensis]
MNDPARRPGRRRLRAVASVAGAALASTALVAFAAPAAAIGAERTELDTSGLEPGRYIVVLDDAAAAAYDGGVTGYAATAPVEGEQLDAEDAHVEEYAGYLESQQEDVAASVDAEVGVSYSLTLNAFSAELDTTQITALARDEKVVGLVPDELLKPTAVPSTDFLGLSGDDGVWAAVGGAEAAGEGVVVGVLDTGIAPENASFAGEALGTSPSAEPYLDGSSIVFDKADGSTFTGVCQSGVQFAADDCSTKIIGARYFVQGFGAANIGSTAIGEYLSPRDGASHGSHTASTAAGNADVPVTLAGHDYGTISGVAPAAKIAAYKVCWEGKNPAATTDDGCTTTDLLAGIDAAVQDGVDVINFSIGGGTSSSTFELTDQAFFNAAAAGIFVSASAGNSGPSASTLDNSSPWITTVAASTIPSYEATATTGDGAKYPGASTTVWEPLSGDLVRADDVRLAGKVAADALLCAPGSLDPALAAGKIVLCQRGTYDRVAKSAEVARAGGIGVVLVNSTPGSLDADTHSVPTIHISDAYWAALSAYAATPGATVSLTPDNTSGIDTPTPQVAGFSSRGPIVVDGADILKPDISAPGVAILAAAANPEGAESAYTFMSGTSMAAPHIAGLAALYLGERPNATPAEIKSAMMTTAYDTLSETGETVTDPFAQGAGHVDPTRFFEPGLLYLNDIGDWAAYVQGIGAYDFGVEPVAASDLNLASISVGELTAPETVTRTVTATQDGTFSASISGLAGVKTTVSPKSLRLKAGESKSFTVKFDRTDAPLDEWATGSLTWTSGDTSVRSPIAVQPVTAVVPEAVAGFGVDGSVKLPIVSAGDGALPITTLGLAKGVLLPDPYGETSEHSGIGSNTSADPEYEWLVDVADGQALARFDVDSLLDESVSDLDLSVYKLDDAAFAQGRLVATALWQSATGSADERVDLSDPAAGKYYVLVDVYTGVDVPFDFTLLQLGAEGEGDFTVAPNPVKVKEGKETTVSASWKGLAAGEYLGVVRVGDGGAETVVSVSAPVAPVNTAVPTISGSNRLGAVLTAKPGTWDVEGLSYTYQWYADGQPIWGGVFSKLVLLPRFDEKDLTVVVTAKKAGYPAVTATSAPFAVDFPRFGHPGHGWLVAE